jgi:hypothetical protein
VLPVSSPALPSATLTKVTFKISVMLHNVPGILKYGILAPAQLPAWAAPGVRPCIPWNTHDFCDKHKYMYTCIMIQHVSLLNVAAVEQLVAAAHELTETETHQPYSHPCLLLGYSRPPLALTGKGGSCTGGQWDRSRSALYLGPSALARSPPRPFGSRASTTNAVAPCARHSSGDGGGQWSLQAPPRLRCQGVRPSPSAPLSSPACNSKANTKDPRSILDSSE